MLIVLICNNMYELRTELKAVKIGFQYESALFLFSKMSLEN